MLKKIFAAVMLLLIFSLALISCDKPQPTQPAENKDPETVDYDEVTYNVTVKLTSFICKCELFDRADISLSKNTLGLVIKGLLGSQTY